jgi:hypothetical protein
MSSWFLIAQPSFAQRSYSNSILQSPYTEANKILAVSSQVAQTVCFPVAAAELLGHQAHQDPTRIAELSHADRH